MKIFLVALALAIAAGVTALAVQQHRANAELRRAIAGLQVQLEKVEQHLSSSVTPRAASVGEPTPAAIVTPERPLLEPNDLARLREELAALKASTDQLNKFAQQAQAAAALKQAEANAPAKLTPVTELKNAGQTTPESAVETVIWAAAAGDVDALAGAIAFNAAARAKADAWFASLSEATRRQYGSPEKVAALMIAKDAAALSGLQVIGQRELNPNEVGVRIRVADDQGRTKDDNWLMHRSNAGWQLMLPEGAVEKFARQLRPGAK